MILMQTRQDRKLMMMPSVNVHTGVANPSRNLESVFCFGGHNRKHGNANIDLVIESQY